PNIEIRNPKQIRISNVQMIKTNSLKQDVSVIDAFRVLVIGSNFELRISDFLNENLVFVQALYIMKRKIRTWPVSTSDPEGGDYA
ncbi:MAG: hypothetical protein R6U97_08260, partial [Desulfosalsimonas sp.]